MTAAPGGAVRVRGGATAEELAAVLATLTRQDAAPEPDGYERWRRERLRVTSGRATRATVRPS